MDVKYSFSATSILSSEEITLMLSKHRWAEIFRGKVKDGPSVIKNIPSSYLVPCTTTKSRWLGETTIELGGCGN